MDFLEAGPVRIPLAEVRQEYSRAGGPGGQNVNKLETRVTVRFPLRDSPSVPEALKERALGRLGSRLNDRGELLVSSQRSRSQWQNREDCLERLRRLLEEAFRPPKPRHRTKPTRSSRERRLEKKRQSGEKKRSRRYREGDTPN